MSSVESKSEEDSYVWRPDESIETPSLESPNIEEEVTEDFYMAVSESDSTYSGVKGALEEEGSNTEVLRPSDIERGDENIYVDGVEASDFDGTIFYRPNTWFSDFDEDEKLDKMGLMAELESEYDVDFYGGGQSALISRDKKATKNVYESRGVDGVESYSLEEAMNKLEEGEEIVAKPRKGTCSGDLVELIESGEGLENYVDRVMGDLGSESIDENLLFEEHYETGEGAENSDMRMVVLNDEIYRMERSGGEGLANNLNNNGDYVEPPEISSEEKKLAEETEDIFRKGFYAVDYIRTEDGEVKVMENNATPGTKIDEELDLDIEKDIARDAYHAEEGDSVTADMYESQQSSVII